jgi:hypothetical protein
MGQLRAPGACFGEEEKKGIGVGGFGELVEGGLEGGGASAEAAEAMRGRPSPSIASRMDASTAARFRNCLRVTPDAPRAWVSVDSGFPEA